MSYYYHRPHRYRGHRAKSFFPLDVNELIELRARQRTFHGAYNRTALGTLGYALTFLRLFDSRFYRIGLLFAALSGLLFIIAVIRLQHSQHDFADRTKEDPSFERAVVTLGQETKRVYGRPFVTAGWIVISVSIIVAIAEIGLLALIVQV